MATEGGVRVDHPDDAATSDHRRCFVARPISVKDASQYRDGSQHWSHVHEYLITPAVQAAGYVVVPPESSGATVIQADIVKNLNECEMVIADFSTLNANVAFEAGVRTSFGKPLVIIAEAGTQLPFDTARVNAWFYNPDLNRWHLDGEIEALTKHIKQTSTTGNALWTRFGVHLQAETLESSATPEDAGLTVLMSAVDNLTHQVNALVQDRFASPISAPPSGQQLVHSGMSMLGLGGGTGDSPSGRSVHTTTASPQATLTPQLLKVLIDHLSMANVYTATLDDLVLIKDGFVQGSDSEMYKRWLVDGSRSLTEG